MMPNSDPRDRLVYPFLKLMLDSFFSILLDASTKMNSDLHENTNIYVHNLEENLCHFDVVTSFNNKVM